MEFAEEDRTVHAEEDAMAAADGVVVGMKGAPDEKMKEKDTAAAIAAAADEAIMASDAVVAVVGKLPMAVIGIASVEAAQAAAVTAQPAPNAILDSARGQVSEMTERNELDTTSSSSLQTLFREHEALKDKVSKLKALLGRSAKAQREAKVDLDGSNKKLESAIAENQLLRAKIDKLAARPTHMELLADFETNFDRALLSVGHQSGGQDTSGTAMAAAAANANPNNSSNTFAVESSRKDRSVFDPFGKNDGTAAGAGVVDTLLLQELSDSKQRIEKLEQLNAARVQRARQLEGDLEHAQRSMTELRHNVSRLELEKRMAVMEAEQAVRAMREKGASLAEMQMEIEMVTKSAQKAAVRAAVGEEMIKTVKVDKLHAQHLEEKVQVLHEWALACNQAKTLAQERARLLDTQLRRYHRQQQQQQHPPNGGLDGIMSGEADGGLLALPPQSSSSYDDDDNVNNNNEERILDSVKASLVIGAGDVGVHVFALEPDLVDADLVDAVNSATERIVLRWTFDLTHDGADIIFGVFKGSCETAAQRKSAGALIKDRVVKGGAGGEIEHAFAIGQACTLVWSNRQSWIRPRTVTFSVEAVVLSED